MINVKVIPINSATNGIDAQYRIFIGQNIQIIDLVNTISISIS